MRGAVVVADAMMSGGDGQPETLAGVTVTLDGEHAMGETMETDMSGGFAFTGLRAGTYTVTISDFPEDVSFETVSVEVEVEVGGVGNADFTGHFIRTSAVEGEVIIDGDGLAGVTVTLIGGPADENFTTMTDSDGMYRFEDLRPGDYTVSISDFDTRDYNFAVASQDVSVDLGETATVPFTGQLLRTSAISGRVSVEGVGLSGIEVTLSGGDTTRTETTDAGGQFNFAGLAAGSYTVSIAVDDPAYVFNEMSKTVTVDDNDAQIVPFDGQHARTASVSGRFFIDELDKNDMMDAGEHPAPTPAPGARVDLVGPGVGQTTSTQTRPDGSFMFSGLRAGTYQLVVPIDAAAAAALMANDVAYGGEAAGYRITLGVGEAASRDIPLDITHTTVNFTVSLKSGEEMGDALPGASVQLYGANNAMVDSGMTGDDGSVELRVRRDMTSGNMVNAGVSADGYDVADGMTAVSWDPQSFDTEGSNSNDIVNLNVDVTISGATVDRGDYGGGEALAGWEIDVMMGDAAVAGAPTALGDDGSAAFTTTVESVPASFSFAVADDQDNELDGGEMYEASGGGYTHTGLKLAGNMAADPIVVTYTTQTLKVFVHHERDQVRGFTGNVGHADVRMSGLVNLEIRHASGNDGRFTSPVSNDDWDARANTSDKDGVYTFSHLPADMDIVVRADVAMDGYKLLDLERLDTYRNMDENGVTGGAFGAMGGSGHTVALCPLEEIEPTGQDFGDCASFGVVSLHNVSGLVWKRSVATDDGTGFKITDPKFESGVEVSLDPVDGKNLAGVGGEFTTTSKNDATTPFNDTHQFDFGSMAAGSYDLEVSDGWRVMLGDKGSEDPVGTALDPLGADVVLDVTPMTTSLYGFVRDEAGFGLKGVPVEVNGQTVETDHLGRYVAPGVAAAAGKKINVSIKRDGYPTTKKSTAFVANMPTQLDITLSGANNTVTITGTVTDADTDQGIKGVRIKVDNKDPLNGALSGDYEGQVVTGDNGTYTAVVEARGFDDPSVMVSVSHDDYHFQLSEKPAIVTPGSVVEGLDFEGSRTVEITGRVTGPGGGMPLAEVTVTAYSNADFSGKLDAVTTTETGTFAVHVPPYSGAVYLEAKPRSDYTPADPNFQNLRDSERYVWFDPPTNRPNGAINVFPNQPSSFGTFKGNSVQPRITSVKRVTVTADVAAGGITNGPGAHALVKGEPTDTIEVKWVYETRNVYDGSGTVATPVPGAAYSAENAPDGSVAADGTQTFTDISTGANVPLATMSDTATAFYGVAGDLLTLASTKTATAGATVSHTRTTKYVLDPGTGGVGGDVDDYGAITLRIGHDVVDADGVARPVSVDGTNVLQYGGDNASTGIKTLGAVAGAVTGLTATRTVTVVSGGRDTHMLTAGWEVKGSPQLQQRIALEVNISATGNEWEWIVFGAPVAQPAISRATNISQDTGSGWGDWHFPTTTAAPAVTFDLNNPASVDGSSTDPATVTANWQDDDGVPVQGYTINMTILSGARSLRVDTKVDGGDWVKGPEASINTVQSGS